MTRSTEWDMQNKNTKIPRQIGTRCLRSQLESFFFAARWLGASPPSPVPTEAGVTPRMPEAATEHTSRHTIHNDKA